MNATPSTRSTVVIVSTLLLTLVLAGVCCTLQFLQNRSLTAALQGVTAQLDQNRLSLAGARNEVVALRVLAQKQEAVSQSIKRQLGQPCLGPVGVFPKVASFCASSPVSPELPVEVAFRKALLGRGYVVQLVNLSTRSQALRLSVTNATFRAGHTFKLLVDGRQTAELGHLQGWSFASGDQLKLAGRDGVVQSLVVP